MDNDDNHTASADSVQDGRPWGAQRSLRRNAGLDTNAASHEATPLLANGDSSAGDGSDTAAEWEGANDFLGVPWWKKPSVCRHPYTLECPPSYNCRCTGCCQLSPSSLSHLVES